MDQSLNPRSEVHGSASTSQLRSSPIKTNTLQVPLPEENSVFAVKLWSLSQVKQNQ
jgi:hypothetical protein